MAFDDNAIFPEDISYASRGGPGFRTDLIEVDSGAEERIARNAAQRHRFNVAYGIESLNQLDTVRVFYIARRGPAVGFRFKDPFDFSTASDHRGTPAFNDETIAQGDGTTTQFQLIKRYLNGSVQRVRNIEKPIESTVLIGVGNPAVPVATGWSVNPATGIVTFTTPPPDTHFITWGGEFHLPARFGKEIDELLDISYDEFEQGAIADIPIIELIGEQPLEEEYFYGGSYLVDPMTASISISPSLGRVVRVVPHVPGLTIDLPPKAIIPNGAPWFYVVNDGSQNVLVRDGDTLNPVVTVVSGGGIREFFMSEQKWTAF